MLRWLILAFALLAAVTGALAEPVAVQMYKNPQCGCCEEYAKYLRQHGFKVTVTPTHNMSIISRKNGVPERLAGCHTMLVEGYVDLAYRDGSSMVVVDFKTDRELDGALDQYRRQVSLYGSAIGQTAGLPTKIVLMRV